RCGGPEGLRKRDSTQRSMAGGKPDNDILKYGEDLPKQRPPPRRRDAFHGLPDLVVGGRCAGRDAHRERPARQPPGHYLLLLGPYGTEADRPGLRIDAARVFYVIGRCPVM